MRAYSLTICVIAAIFYNPSMTRSSGFGKCQLSLSVVMLFFHDAHSTHRINRGVNVDTLEDQRSTRRPARYHGGTWSLRVAHSCDGCCP
jgi:hypothetical protein